MPGMKCKNYASVSLPFKGSVYHDNLFVKRNILLIIVLNYTFFSFIIYPPASKQAKQVGEFIEIRHKKTWVSVTLKLCHSVTLYNYLNHQPVGSLSKAVMKIYTNSTLKLCIVILLFSSHLHLNK